MANQSFFFIWGPVWHVRAPHVTFFFIWTIDYQLSQKFKLLGNDDFNSE